MEHPIQKTAIKYEMHFEVLSNHKGEKDIAVMLFLVTFVGFASSNSVLQ